MGVIVLQNGTAAAVARSGKQTLRCGVAYHISGGQPHHAAQQHRCRGKLCAAARVALAQEIQQRVGVVGCLGVRAVTAVLVQPAAHQCASAIDVIIPEFALLHQRSQFLVYGIVPGTVGHIQAARTDISGVGAFQTVQHPRVIIVTGRQQFLCLFARKIVEHIVLHGLPRYGSVAVRRVVVVKICVVRRKRVGIVCMQTMYGHLLRLCAAVCRAQKRQVRNGKPPVAVGFPVCCGTVEGSGIPCLPACAVIVHADKPAQVDGLLRFGVGRDHYILQPRQRQAVAPCQAAVLHAARSSTDMEIQCPAADFRQPLDRRAQCGRADFVGHRLQRVQGQHQHGAQCQGRQKQHRANGSHADTGQPLVYAVGLQVGGIDSGTLAAPQPFAHQRPRRRTASQPARQKQQPAQNGTARPRQQRERHDRQKHRPQQQRVGVAGCQRGQKHCKRHCSQQRKQAHLRRNRRGGHHKICVEACIQAQPDGIRALCRTGQKRLLHGKQQRQRRAEDKHAGQLRLVVYPGGQDIRADAHGGHAAQAADQRAG